jgi:hypothetical protein
MNIKKQAAFCAARTLVREIYACAPHSAGTPDQGESHQDIHDYCQCKAGQHATPMAFPFQFVFPGQASP